ncbi:hypothetical protein JW978_04125 [Candidatus Dojkabacteria bacterium]|nr:hypothetical protein [Candidatus Dojkabacteria bacterium]
MKILLVDPKNYDLKYSINPWMNLNQSINKDLAKRQWNKVRNELETANVKVSVCNSEEHLPDMVFAANAGMVVGEKVILSSFRDEERQSEKKYFMKWFTSNGFEVVNLPKNMVWEGEACSVIVGDWLLASYGIRADKEAYEDIIKHLKIKKVKLVELIDPYFYHLDVCFSMISPEVSLVCPLGFKNSDYDWILGNVKHVIEVSYDDALNFGCNIFSDGKNVFISSRISEKLEEDIIKAGFIVHKLDVSEYIKTGGGVKCLILNLS